MSLFGDPRAPRRNLWGGLVIAALGAFLAGLAVAALSGPERWTGARRYDWLQLALAVLIVFGAVMQFRLGLREVRLPPRAATTSPDAPSSAMPPGGPELPAP